VGRVLLDVLLKALKWHRVGHHHVEVEDTEFGRDSLVRVVLGLLRVFEGVEGEQRGRVESAQVTAQDAQQDERA